ncbi:MAG: peptidylprolyl isomerase [bacterium]|nr:peptidylprolyl isomerase [bacterium]
MKTILLKIALVLFLAVLAFVTIFIFGVYCFGWNGKATRTFVSIVPLPVATVNGRVISFADYWDLQEIGSNFLAATLENEQETKNRLVAHLVDNRITSDILKKRSQSPAFRLEDYEIHLGRKFGNQAELSDRAFRKLIVLPDWNEISLRIWWYDQDTGSQSYDLASLVVAHLGQGGQFENLASIYSDDLETKYIGGDMGFVTAEELPPWFSEAIMKLSLGQTSGILSGPDGYYILKLAAINETEGVKKMRIKQIYIKSETFEEFFKTEKQKYRVLIFKNL